MREPRKLNKKNTELTTSWNNIKIYLNAKYAQGKPDSVFFVFFQHVFSKAQLMCGSCPLLAWGCRPAEMIWTWVSWNGAIMPSSTRHGSSKTLALLKRNYRTTLEWSRLDKRALKWISSPLILNQTSNCLGQSNLSRSLGLQSLRRCYWNKKPYRMNAHTYHFHFVILTLGPNRITRSWPGLRVHKQHQGCHVNSAGHVQSTSWQFSTLGLAIWHQSICPQTLS